MFDRMNEITFRTFGSQLSSKAITPFGSERAWPVIADASIMGLERVAIGGGKRGVNLHLAPADLVAATGAAVLDVTQPEAPREP